MTGGAVIQRVKGWKSAVWCYFIHRESDTEVISESYESAAGLLSLVELCSVLFETESKQVSLLR